MTLEGRFAATLHDSFGNDPPARLGVAVSGGGDSMALLHLAAVWSPAGTVLEAVTVDHGLRPHSAAEARTVAAAAAALDLRHSTLTWGGWDGAGNLQDAARRARRRLIADWAQSSGIGTVLTGHTMDDQAETVLMRLARGSGVDGLAGIPRTSHSGIDWVRPLLSTRRADLREWLSSRGVPWVEDPTNEDNRFDRVRARRLLGELSGLGLTIERLALAARHMRNARGVLERAAQDLAARAVRTELGDVLIRRAALGEAAVETRMRLLSAALLWVAGAEYRPRYAALERLASEGGVLHGCLMTFERDDIRVTRELAAVHGHETKTDELWDRRWRLRGPHCKELRVAPLTRDGLSHCPDWRSAGMPSSTLQAMPAVWRGRDLVAAPLAGHSAGWEASLVPGRDEFIIGEIPR